MRQSDIYRMIARRALAAKVRTKIGCHSFIGTLVLAYFLVQEGDLRSTV